MVLPLPNLPTTGLFLDLASAASQHVPNLHTLPTGAHSDLHVLQRRDPEEHDVKFIVFACLIPVLVLLSGLFSGLTLGLMSLDETQLKVLSISGTPEQKKYAAKIHPIRKNGHLLLITLILANMIVNESLPVISDPVLGGGVQSVIVSTVLIVIFAEIIPQTLCTRYGLYFGAKLAGFVRVLILLLGVVAWPVSKLLEFTLGPHHGIIYRRAELKELIAMHSNGASLGGDLKMDTVTIIGGALDLQEKVVRQAMTPIKDVFMVSIDAKLDYETLRKICQTGHSRIPVYEEVEIPLPNLVANVNISEADFVNTRGPSVDNPQQRTQKVTKIVGVLLVKQCVLLDPNDATPVRNIPLNKVPFVPNNEPLLGILDKFQEGRSHMAVVSRFSVERAISVKKAVKRGLTQRLRDRVLSADSDSSSSDDDEPKDPHRKQHGKKKKGSSSENDQTVKDDVSTASDGLDIPHVRMDGRDRGKGFDIEMGMVEDHTSASKRNSIPKAGAWGREQSMPADAVLTKEGVNDFLQSVDPAIMPLGIITLEDVLEELIGEEIYDEFDPQGHPDLSSYVQPELKAVPTPSSATKSSALPALRNLNFKVPGFQRSRSTPPMSHEDSNGQEKEKEAPLSVGGVAAPEVTRAEALPPSDTNEKGAPTPTIVIPNPEIAIVAPSPVVPQSVIAAANIPRVRSGLMVGPGGAPAGTSLVPARNTSPSPSLEQAIRVERKRRAASASGNQNAVKGGWFKSSPLNDEDRSDVIVAERVKRDMQAEGGSAPISSASEYQMPPGGGASEPEAGSKPESKE